MLKSLKTKIIWCLENLPDTRNSDVRLTSAVWVNFCSELLSKTQNGDYSVKLLDLYELPREDAVKRVRAKLNAKGLFLPSKPKVRKARNINEEVWRKFLGLNPEIRTVI